MMTTADLPKMLCVECKEYFWPRAPFLETIQSKKIPNVFYFCEKCIKKLNLPEI